jgi:hypothetical protein
MRPNLVSDWLAKLRSGLWKECWLLVGGTTLDKRIREWEEHVRNFGWIARREEPLLCKAEGLKFAFNHLNALDSKFGFLLSSQVFLAAAVGFSVNTFPWEKIDLAPMFVRLPLATWRMIIFFLALVWFVNIIITLYGMYRLVWGGLRIDESSNEDDIPALARAAKHYVTQLVTGVAQRTAIYRIAIATTIAGVVLAAPFMFAVIYLKSQQIPPGQQTGQGYKQQPSQGQQVPQGEHTAQGQTTSPLPPEPAMKYELVSHQEYVAGRLSHSHTFLLNRQTGEIRQMICRRGTKLVEFRVVSPP